MSTTNIIKMITLMLDSGWGDRTTDDADQMKLVCPS